jgi:D-inositol-3-phosphate glycosyltransferase
VAISSVESQSRPRVLAVGHGASATGFSRVLDTLIRQLGDRYDFHHFATNHRSDRVAGDWPIYGNSDRLDANGLDRLGELIGLLQPQIVLLLNDLWFCSLHANRLKSAPERPQLVAYCPVDGILTRPERYSALNVFDQIVAYTQFGKQELEKIVGRENTLSSAGVTKSIEVIPHGVDSNVFFPLNGLLDRSQAKQQLFGDSAAEADFVVFNAAKHDARKRLDLTIEGFARFAQDKPDKVKLYLHTGATFDGPDIRELVRKVGIADRLITTPGWLEDHPAVDDQQLNLMYNATDVGINTSSGEGWGLVSFEHAATGAPQIVPAHSACLELWSELETVLPIRHQGEHMGLGMMRQFVDADDIAELLEKLYVDQNFRHEQARRAYEIAGRSAYRWELIARQWDDLFQRLLSAPRHQ